jgi:hypothetical protein
MKPRSLFFPALLGGVVALFLGILGLSWYFAEKANPVILDERGQVRGSRTR